MIRFDLTLDSWVVEGYEDVARLLADSAVLSSAQVVSASRPPLPASASVRLAGWRQTPYLVGIDPPEHTRVRGIVNRAVAAAPFRAVEPHLGRIADRLLDAFISQESVDIISAYAGPLPLLTMAHWLGIPEGDARHLARGVTAWMALLRRVAPEKADAEADRFLEFAAYIVEAASEAGTGTFLHALRIAQDARGDALSSREVVDITLDFLVGGYPTVTRALGTAFYVLARLPDGFPSSVAVGLVDEILRLEPPTQAVRRIARQDFELDGMLITAGDLVILDLSTANRDPDLFPDAAAFNSARERAGQHLAFGRGGHSCPGARFARRQLVVALEAAARRMPNLSLLPGGLAVRDPYLLAKGFVALEVTWDRPAAAR